MHNDETQDDFPSFTAGGNEAWLGRAQSLVRGYRRVCGRAVKSGSGYQASVHIW